MQTGESRVDWGIRNPSQRGSREETWPSYPLSDAPHDAYTLQPDDSWDSSFGGPPQEEPPVSVGRAIRATGTSEWGGALIRRLCKGGPSVEASSAEVSRLRAGESSEDACRPQPSSQGTGESAAAGSRPPAGPATHAASAAAAAALAAEKRTCLTARSTPTRGRGREGALLQCQQQQQQQEARQQQQQQQQQEGPPTARPSDAEGSHEAASGFHCKAEDGTFSAEAKTDCGSECDAAASNPPGSRGLCALRRHSRIRPGVHKGTCRALAKARIKGTGSIARRAMHATRVKGAHVACATD
ncbi:androgen receptor [Cyclospora cayetanensis]|uniref:Androgen receptor n=1 Tax=Cyclospora cayetanensis TaxID=88456 RepID=A0A6P6S3M4_9EIME|nr:androgen receptor [Cyclospora cayetanensis]